MKTVLGNAAYWVAGVLAGVVGVLIARVIAPHAAGSHRLWLTVAGQMVALGGLLLICVGVSRRLRRDQGTT